MLSCALLALCPGLPAPPQDSLPAARRDPLSRAERPRGSAGEAASALRLAALALAEGDRALGFAALQEAPPQPETAWIRAWLAARLEPALRRFPGAVERVAADPAGRRLALLGSEARIVDLATGETLVRLEGTQSDAAGFAWSGDGRFLLAASVEMQGWALWDAATGRRLENDHTRGTSVGNGHALAAAPQGATFALAMDWGVFLGEASAEEGMAWRRSSSEAGGVGRGAVAPTALCWSADGEALVVGDEAGRVEWIPEAGEGRPRPLARLGSEVRNLAVERGGRRVLACTADLSLHLLEEGAEPLPLWTAASPAEAREAERLLQRYKRFLTAGVRDSALWAGPDRVLHQGSDGWLRLLRLDGTVLLELPVLAAPATSLAAVPGTELVAVSSTREGAAVLDLARLRALAGLGREDPGAADLAATPGRLFLLRSDGVRILDATGGRLAEIGFRCRPVEIAAAPGGEAAWAVLLDPWPDRESGGQVLRLTLEGAEAWPDPEGSDPRGVAVDAEGRRVAVADPEGEVFLREARSGEVLQHLRWDSGRRRRDEITRAPLAFLADGRLWAGAGQTVTLWDPGSGALLYEFRTPGLQVRALAAAPGGGLAVFSVEEDTRLRAADLERGEIRVLDPPLPAPETETGGPGALVFTPDGRGFLSAAGREGRILLWDARRLRPLLPLTRTGFETSALTFTGPDASRLAAAGWSGLRLWPLL